MTEDDYKKFYDGIGLANGWNFSSVRSKTEGETRNIYDEAAKHCSRSSLWLDIGTGGGEAILPHAESALLVIGIDRSEAMIQTAMENGSKSRKTNVRFITMDAHRMDFPDNFFDLLTCRHSDFCAKEAARVLRPGGYFLTQQVGERDKWNVKQAFGRGQNYHAEDGALLQKYSRELTEAGFQELQTLEWNAVEYYESYEDLVFLLKYTPIIPDFGQDEEDFLRLHRFIQEHQTAQGIQTNAKRFMLIARK